MRIKQENSERDKNVEKKLTSDLFCMRKILKIEINGNHGYIFDFLPSSNIYIFSKRMNIFNIMWAEAFDSSILTIIPNKNS